MNLQLANDIMNAMISAGEQVVGVDNLPEEVIAAARSAYVGAVVSRYAPFVADEQARELFDQIEATTIKWVRAVQGRMVQRN